MTDYLIPPPGGGKSIPITRKTDRAYTIRRVDPVSRDPLDFPENSTCYMWVYADKTNPTKVDATISGSMAAFHLQSELLDLCRSGTKWSIVLDLGDNEIPVRVGIFERNDG